MAPFTILFILPFLADWVIIQLIAVLKPQTFTVLLCFKPSAGALGLLTFRSWWTIWYRKQDRLCRGRRKEGAGCILGAPPAVYSRASLGWPSLQTPSKRRVLSLVENSETVSASQIQTGSCFPRTGVWRLKALTLHHFWKPWEIRVRPRSGRTKARGVCLDRRVHDHKA